MTAAPLVPLEEILLGAQSGFASGVHDSDGIVQVRMNNVTREGNLIWDKLRRVPTSEKKLAKYSLEPGDVMFNATNSPELVGKTALFGGFTEPVVFSNHFVRLRVDRAKVVPTYLARWLLVQWKNRIFENIATRWVNQAAVRKDDLLALQIPLPPLDEQKRIAAVLNTADRLRRLRRYALELSEGFLQSVFLEMFGDPVTNPMGWRTERLSRNIRLTGGYAFRSDDFIESGLPLIRIGTVNSGFFKAENLAFLPEEYSTIYRKYLLKPRDLVITLTGTVGKDDYGNICQLGTDYPIYLLNQRVAKIDLYSQAFLPEYLLYAFKMRSVKWHLTKLSRGIRQANISNDDILELELAAPEKTLQERFVEVVETHQAMRRKTGEAIRQADHLFDTLLQRAFRGELWLAR